MKSTRPLKQNRGFYPRGEVELIHFGKSMLQIKSRAQLRGDLHDLPPPVTSSSRRFSLSSVDSGYWECTLTVISLESRLSCPFLSIARVT